LVCHNGEFWGMTNKKRHRAGAQCLSGVCLYQWRFQEVSRLDCLLSGRGWLFRCQLLENAIEQAKVEQKDGNRDEGFIF